MAFSVLPDLRQDRAVLESLVVARRLTLKRMSIKTSRNSLRAHMLNRVEAVLAEEECRANKMGKRQDQDLSLVSRRWRELHKVEAAYRLLDLTWAFSEHGTTSTMKSERAHRVVE